MRSGAGGRRSRCDSVPVSGRPPPLSLDSTSVSSSSVMAITWSSLRERRVHRRIEQHFAVPRMMPMTVESS